MPVIKSASTFDGTTWGEAVPFGADSVNITMTNVAALPTTDTSVTLTNADTAMENSETLTSAANKYNRLRQRIVNKFSAIDTTLGTLAAYTTRSIITAVTANADNTQIYTAKAVQDYFKNVLGITNSKSANIVAVSGENQTTVKNALIKLNDLINTVNGKFANYIRNNGKDNSITGYQYNVKRDSATADGFHFFMRFYQKSRNMLTTFNVTHTAGTTASQPHVGYVFGWYAKRKKTSSDSTLVDQEFARIGARIYYPEKTVNKAGTTTTFKNPRSEVVLQSTGYDINAAASATNYVLLGMYQTRAAYVGLSHPSAWRQALRIKSGTVTVGTAAADTGVQVKFTTAFSSKPTIICTCEAAMANKQDTFVVTIANVSTTGFYVQVHNIHNKATGADAYVRNVTNNRVVHWIAIEQNNA